jgi:hypothetical protein
MNRARELARGEYVCVLHDGDVNSPNILERESKMLERYPIVGMVHCAIYEFDADGSRRQIIRSFPTTGVLPGKQEYLGYLQCHKVGCSSVVARRTLFEVVGPFDTCYLSADFLMWIKRALRVDVAYPLLNIRMHPDAYSSRLDPRRWHHGFISILTDGLALGARVFPSLADERQKVFRVAARAQARRLPIAALSQLQGGAHALGQPCVRVPAM